MNIYKLEFNHFGEAFIVASNYSEVEQLFKDTVSKDIPKDKTFEEVYYIKEIKKLSNSLSLIITTPPVIK